MSEADGVTGISTRDRDWIRRAALHYIERYASTVSNLERVLRRKVRRRADLRGEPVPPEEVVAALVAEAVAHCRALGLVDDRAFAESKLAGARRKGESRARIAARLSAKGVDRETVSAVLEADETDDRAAVVRFLQRKRLGPFRTREPADVRDAESREMAAICRAGFAYGLARWAIGLDRDTAEAALAGGIDGGD